MELEEDPLWRTRNGVRRLLRRAQVNQHPPAEYDGWMDGWIMGGQETLFH
jgi:hypothetical protein